MTLMIRRQPRRSSTPPIASHSTPQTTARTFLALATVVLLTSLSPSRSTLASEPELPELELHTQHVMVFKDGFALFVKQGTATTDDEGRLVCADVPDEAILGTVWAGSDEAKLEHLTSRWVDDHSIDSKSRDCESIGELLIANVKNKVTLTLSDDSIVEGTLRKVIGPKNEIAQPIEEPRQGSVVTQSVTQIRAQPTHAILNNIDGDVLIPIDMVRRVAAENLDIDFVEVEKRVEKAKQFVFDFDQPNTEVNVTLIYFRPGLRWVPTYHVALTPDDDASAQIRLQAEILNESESLQDVSIDLVVGVPNFRFRDTASPLTLEQQLRTTMQQAMPQLSNQLSNFNNYASNGIFTQRAGNTTTQPAADPNQANLPTELTTVKAQDLFVYHLNPMSLKQGERAAIGLFETKVACRHVYSWEIHLKQDGQLNLASSNPLESPLAITENKIWHQIELTNNTELPWTTGAAMMVQGAQPLAQELLTYTPVGQNVRIPLTIAVDLQGNFQETELGRDLQALRWDGQQYAKVSRQAAIEICNHKTSPVDLEITCQIGGEATKTTQDGEIRRTSFQAQDWNQYRGSPAVNAHSTVRWKTRLNAGETFETLTDYHAFFRH